MNSLAHQRFPTRLLRSWQFFLAAFFCLTINFELRGETQGAHMVFREIGVQRGLEGRAITDVSPAD